MLYPKTKISSQFPSSENGPNDTGNGPGLKVLAISGITYKPVFSTPSSGSKLQNKLMAKTLLLLGSNKNAFLSKNVFLFNYLITLGF